jgi:hypothetical protein
MPCVYFIRKSNRDVYKIGMSGTAAESRLKALQTASEEPLALCAFIECDRSRHAIEVERYLHNSFAKYRLHGEWFSLSWVDVQSVLRYYKEKGYSVEYRDLVPPVPRFVVSQSGQVKEKSEMTLSRAMARIATLEKANKDLIDGKINWLRRQARAELYPEIRIAKAEIEARDKEIAHLKRELARARAKRRGWRYWLRQVWGFFTLNPPKE